MSIFDQFDRCKEFGEEEQSMSEVSLVEKNNQLFTELSDVLSDGANNLSDVSETLVLIDSPHARVVQKAVEEIAYSLSNANSQILRDFFEPDERDKYLDNLMGYFNEETGTWYEQVCQNFKNLTGFSANKWDALTWTIHLSLGHSTFYYLVHIGYIHLDTNGKAVVDGLESGEKFGWNIERIQYLIDTDFRDLL